MIEGKTSKGFSFVLPDEVLDDMELLEGLTELDNDNYSHLKETITALLGQEQKAALYDFCRNKETKRVSAKMVMAELGEIFQAAEGNLKN